MKGQYGNGCYSNSSAGRIIGGMASLRSITMAKGYRAAGGAFGIKASRRPDLALIVSDVPASMAAVFTQNAVVGAPVTVGRRHVRRGSGRAIVCNAGIANVATGPRGIDHAIAMCRVTAECLGCQPHEVLPASTGVIGHLLPIRKIVGGIRQLADRLERSAEADARAARAIMTTDTVPKSARRTIKLAGTTVHIGGIAKGAGMIAPNMATMLGFLTTDAAIARPLLRRALTSAANADASFNRLSIDSDTSTSDTVAILANGAAGNRAVRTAGRDFSRFADALADLCRDLAYKIVADGEGVEHVIRVIVRGAKSDADALRMARSVADSPLVKTAVHGADPNWGRILAAAGKCGAKLDPERLTVKLGPLTVFRRGRPTRFDARHASRSMKAPEVAIQLSLGLGKGRCECLGADLSRRYITINADYHT